MGFWFSDLHDLEDNPVLQIQIGNGAEHNGTQEDDLIGTSDLVGDHGFMFALRSLTRLMICTEKSRDKSQSFDSDMPMLLASVMFAPDGASDVAACAA